MKALVAYNMELYLYSLHKTNLSLGSPTPKVCSCEDFDVRSGASIPIGHDFHDDTHCYNLEEASGPSSLLAVVPFLVFSIISDTLEGT